MRRKWCSRLSGGLGEANTGGPQMNIIGKQGGNKFAGSFFINGTGSALQGTNLTPELQAQGLTTPQSLAKAWDINPAFGGPIIRDKLWFFGTLPLPDVTTRTSPACGST